MLLFWLYAVLSKDLGSVNFDYLREPTTPIWDYDIVNGRPVYAPPGTAITNNPDVNGVLYPLPRLSQSNSFEFQISNKMNLFI